MSQRILRPILLSVLVLLLGLDTTSAAAFKRVRAGEPAPSFTLQDLDGKPVSLEEFRGNPCTILVFWALWSPRSLPLLKDVQKLVDEFGPKGLRAVTINVEGERAPADLRDRIRAFLEKNAIHLPVLLDQGLEQYNTWGVIATPATAFLGKDLEVLYEFSGHPTSAYEDMRDQVLKALGLEEEAAQAARPRRERYKADKRVMLHYGLARTLFQRGQFSKAERKLRKVLKQDPGFPDAHALRGVILLGMVREGKKRASLDEARAEFAKAVELDATEPLGLAGLARFALDEGDEAKALDLARRAVEYTEDADLPVLPPLEPAPEEKSEGADDALGKASATGAAPSAEAGAGTPEAQEKAPASGGAPEAQKVQDEGGAPPGPRSVVTLYLERASARLAAGDREGAKALIAPVVEGLLGIPERPHMKGKGRMMLRMKAPSQ